MHAIVKRARTAGCKCRDGQRYDSCRSFLAHLVAFLLASVSAIALGVNAAHTDACQKLVTHANRQLAAHAPDYKNASICPI